MSSTQTQSPDSESDFNFEWDVEPTPPLTTEPDPADDDPAVNIFNALVRDSREICSHCFARIRSVATYKQEADAEWKRPKREFFNGLEASRAVDQGGISYDDYRTHYTLDWRSDTDLTNAYRRGHYRQYDDDGTILDGDEDDWEAGRKRGVLVPKSGSMEPRVSCSDCGWLGSRTQSDDLSERQAVSRLNALCEALTGGGRRYRCPQAPNGYDVEVDYETLRKTVKQKKQSSSEQGRDTEIFQAAVERSTTIEVRPILRLANHVRDGRVYFELERHYPEDLDTDD